MLIPSKYITALPNMTSLSRRVNANSQLYFTIAYSLTKLIKKGEC